MVTQVGIEECDGFLCGDDGLGALAALRRQVKALPAEIALEGVLPWGITADGLDRAAMLARRPHGVWGGAAKLVLDRVLAALAILMLSPLLLAIALAVRLDSPGPVIFRQPRDGWNGRVFTVLKFRSMRVATGVVTAGRVAGSQAGTGQAGAGQAGAGQAGAGRGGAEAGVLRQAARGDARCGRLGRFLRRSSLDELPQLFNVLAGDMSLVGPRPHAVDMRTEHRLGYEIVPGYALRHRVRPGLTGLAQVSGLRGATTTEEQLRARVECDLEYIESWSFLLDIRILARTVVKVFSPVGAF